MEALTPYKCVLYNCQTYFKLDGVGPVDNRPSTEKLQKQKKLTCDM